MNEQEIRKYCLDKATEIFSWRKTFFFKEGRGPLELAEVLYRFITIGEMEPFELPGTRKNDL